LNIGTHSNTSDVVESGVTSLMWGVDSFTAFVPGDSLRTNFYLSVSANASYVSVSYININSSLPSVCTAYIDGSSTVQMGANITAGNAPLVLGIDYSCKTEGKTNIRIDLILPPYNTISFEWTKFSGGSKR